MQENPGKMRTRITPNMDSFYAVAVLCKKLLPAICYSDQQGKMFVTNNYSTLDHSLFLWVFYFYFTTIFVRLSVIAAVCYFNVYKLIGWDPENIYLFKVNYRTLEKGVKYDESTIKQ